jgi:transcriptional regulator with XRE-family HTH domain
MALPDDRRRMVGERLAELREQKALTLHDLEELSGVGADGISKIENGHRKPRPSTLRKLARALGVEAADFFREPALAGKADAPREAGQSQPSEALYIDVERITPILNEVADAVEDEIKKDAQGIERTVESGLPQWRYPEYHKIAQRLADERGWPLEAAQTLVVLMHVESTYGEIPNLRRRITEASLRTPEHRERQAQAEREDVRR